MGWSHKFSFCRPEGLRHIAIIFAASLLISPNISYSQESGFRIELFPINQKLIGDGNSQYSLTFLILDPKGHPLEGQSFKVKSEIGSLSSPEEVTPGFYTTIFKPPKIEKTAIVRIKAWIRMGEGSVAKAYILPIYPEGGLRITPSLNQEAILLGKQKNTRFNLNIKDALGNMVEEAKLKISATAGKVQKIRELGNGRYSAIYIHLPQKHPQVTIVSIRAQLNNEVGFGWLAIPLIGSTVLEAETKPNSLVTIMVGNKKFGPFPSGAQGKFDTPLIVLPGYKYAKATIKDSFGNITEKYIDLKVPRFKRLKMEVDANILVADGKSKAGIRIFVVDEFGLPKRRQRIILSSTQGTLSKILEVNAGLYYAELTAPSLVKEEKIIINASLPEDELSKDSAELKLNPGYYPAILSMNIDPRRLIADGHSQTKISIRLEDAWGNGLSGEPINLRADTGVLSKIVDRGNGDYLAILRSPKGLERKSFINLSSGVRVKLSPPYPEYTLTREAKVYLSAGKPEKAILTATPYLLQADGESSSLINIKIFDAYGNPINGEKLEITASLGQLGEVEDHGDGSYSLKYISSKEKVENKSTITVTNPQRDFTGVTRILLIPKPKNFGIGPKFSYVTNFGSVSGIYPGIECSYIFPWLNRILSISLEAGYYSSSYEESGQDEMGDYKFDIDLNTIPISLNGIYRIPYGLLRPYVGAGLGVLFTNSSLSYSRQPTLTSSSSVFGVHGLGGLELKLGPGSGLVELKYNYSKLNSKLNTSGSGIEGNIVGLIAGVGYRFMF